MQIIFNLEQERETYLEAVAVLHEQLRESQEHYQQLADSHLQITRNLETEVSEGWKEAERWEAKYNCINEAVRQIGLNLCELQEQMVVQPRMVSSPLPAKPTFRVRSLSSDACTVVTNGDLEHDCHGEFNTACRPIDYQPLKGVLVAPGSVAEAIRRINAIHKGNGARKQVESSRDVTPRTLATFRSLGKEINGVLPHNVIDELRERTFSRDIMSEADVNASLIPPQVNTSRVPMNCLNGGNSSRDGRAMGGHATGDSNGCPSLSSRGALCSRCEANNTTVETFWLTEPSPSNHGGWISLRSPRIIGGPYDSITEEDSKSDISKAISLVFDTICF